MSAPSRLSLSLPLPLSPTLSTRSLSPANDGHEHDTTALDRAVASVLLSPSSSSHIALASTRKASLDRDYVVGYMVVHTKKPRKKLFTMHRSYFVVADASKPVLEVFNNESRSELVYLFSLAGANVDFETDNVSHAVRAKCFCLNVNQWKKRGTEFCRPQGFVFYLEDQAQMMVWVKCIHVAIRKASARKDLPADHVSRCSEASTAASESPYNDDSDVSEHRERMIRPEPDESERETHSGGEETVVSVGTTSPSNGDTQVRRSPVKVRSQSRRRAVIDRISGSLQDSPSSKTAHFGRLNAMFAKSPSHQLQSMPTTPTGSSRPKASSEDEKSSSRHPTEKASTAFSPKLMNSLHLPRGKSSSSRQVQGLSSPIVSKRLSDPFQFRKKDDTLFSSFPPFFSPRGPRSAPKQTSDNKKKTKQTEKDCGDNAVHPLQPSQAGDVDVVQTSSDDAVAVPPEQQTLDVRISSHLARLLFLLASCIGGVYQLSVFLPVAAAGVFVHTHEAHSDEFTSAVIAACWVYATSYVQGSLGLCSILAILYGWSYADFREGRRLSYRRIAERLEAQETANFANVDFPNWVVRPDVDRVDWLNKVLENGWPYMKIAIRNSLMDNLNPLLESTRPAFMSSLSLVRVDLGTKVPVISGVKFVSANAKTEEVTIDVDVRIVSDQSLVAELRMVSNLGAAAVVSLRDLFLAGTLRVTLNPLSIYWPCFSSLSLSFTDRPAFDFSLTAAKINISNVPFASEWLQTFLHDLLMDYFVWPNVLPIPLWDETSTTTPVVNP